MKRALIVLTALLSLSAAAAPKKLTLGVFLPTALPDGDGRFKLGESLAQKLSEAVGQPVVAKNFGRYEDFISAANKGQLDVAVVDGWASLLTPAKLAPVALGELSRKTHQRWVIVGRQRALVKDLTGQRLVVPKSTRSAESKLLSNLVFQGDFDASRFKLVAVPNVESALQLLEAKGAEVALMPASHAPKGGAVVFRSQSLPSVVVLAGSDRFDQALASLSVEPLGRFVVGKEPGVAGLKKLLEKGPPPRQCVMAESPTVPLDTAQLVDFGEVERVLPQFADLIEVPKEQPDL